MASLVLLNVPHPSQITPHLKFHLQFNFSFNFMIQTDLLCAILTIKSDDQSVFRILRFFDGRRLFMDCCFGRITPDFPSS